MVGTELWDVRQWIRKYFLLSGTMIFSCIFGRYCTNTRYFGHGSGEQYVKSAQVKRLQRCAVTMLFGCSSGKLRDAGDFEPWGTPFTYLLAGRYILLKL